MKKYLVLTALLFIAGITRGQELKNVILYASLNQFDKAKTEVDSYLGDEKNTAKPEGWYYKAYIYNALGRTETYTVPQSKAMFITAFSAIKKYSQLDPKAKLTNEEKNTTVFNLYNGFAFLGGKSYNSQDYTEAFDCFKKSLEVHDYAFKNGLVGPDGQKFSSHDTDMVWNTLIVAIELQKTDEAHEYRKMIADMDLGDEKYANVYDSLILKYKKEKNVPMFDKYLAAAKKHYPADNEYWETQEVSFAVNGLEKEPLLSKYEELMQRLPNNHMVVYNYALELNDMISGGNLEPATLSDYKKKREELLIKAIGLKSSIEANLLLASTYYNRSFELKERIGKIPGKKPAEITVKNQLIAETKEVLNKAIPYAEEAVKLVSELTKKRYVDKANYKLALEILESAYKTNGNAAKVAEIAKLSAEAENM